jgi:hypothetical protein
MWLSAIRSHSRAWSAGAGSDGISRAAAGDAVDVLDDRRRLRQRQAGIGVE